jgi:hypothetical protein
LRQAPATGFYGSVDKPIAVGIICGAGEVMRAKIKHIRAKIKHIVDDEGDARPLHTMQRE